MLLNDESTWPPAVVRYLEEHRDLFLRWEQPRAANNSLTPDFQQARNLASRYDRAIYGFRAVLKSYSLRGYHCARLTNEETDYIRSSGMQPPSAAILSERIQRLQDSALLDSQVANLLRQHNQAAENNRAGLIWFCFFAPYFAGQWGIERLFRSWGGEALYNSHERDQITGPILQSIGLPCLIEADVPIAILNPHTFLETHLYRQFLVNRGFQTNEPLHYADCATSSIPAPNIKRIIYFTEPDFSALTKCDTWTPPLT